MATTVNRNVNIFISSGEAEKAYDRLIKKEKDLKDQLEKATDPKIVQRLKTELDKLQEPIDRVSKKLNGDLAPSLREQTALVKKLENELKNLSHDDPEFQRKVQTYKQANIELAEMRGRLQQVNASLKDKVFSAGKSLLDGLGIGAGIGIIQAAAEGIKSFFQGSIDESLQAKRANDQLQLSLENLGNTKALKKLTNQADELANKFKFLDNDDIVAAQTKLVDFGKLSTSQIQKLIPVIIDYAAKTKQSVPDASAEFVKALNGQSREMKQFGIHVKETNGVTQNFNLLTTELAQKVKGAASVFGESAEGKIAAFQQAIKNAEETAGNFILSILEGPKTAGQLFDEAKKSTEDYESSLHPLLQRYDELKGKTHLNKDEQNELRGVIQKIVEIVPDSVTEFNKYGEALDINRGKVENFLKVNKQILAEKEFKAVNELIDGISKNLDRVNEKQTRIKEGFKIESGSFGTGSVQRVTLSDEEKQQLLSDIRDLQIKSVEAADVLKGKYGKELPSNIKISIEQIRSLLSGIDKAGDDANNKVIVVKDTIDELQKKIQATTEERDNAIIGSKEYNDAVSRLKVLQDRLDKLLGKGNAKKDADEIKKLIEELNKLQKQTDAKDLSAFQQKLAEINIKFDELVRKAQELNRGDLVDKANKIRQQQIQDALNELLKKGVKIPVTLDDTKIPIVAEEIDKKVTAIAEKGIQVLASSSLANSAKIRELENAIAKTRGRDRLKDELALLEERKRQEVEAAKKIGAETAGIEKKYQKLRADAIKSYYTSTFEGVTELVSKLTDIFGQFNNIINANQNAQLEADRATNDRKKQNYQRQLDAKLISQKEFDQKVAKLDAEQQKREQKVKKDQFRRNQIVTIAQTAINGAQAISKTIAEWGMPYAIPFIIAAGAITAAQIALIASQKAPQFAKGGRLNGPTHVQGGMPVMNPVTGRKVAEVEGGEVILSRNTVRNNAALVDQLLHSSLYNNGAPVVPKWKSNNTSYLNIPVINESMHRVRMFEKGGAFTTTTDNQSTAANTQVLADLQGSIDMLNAQLAAGITAYTNISQSEKQKDRLNAIKADANFK